MQEWEHGLAHLSHAGDEFGLGGVEVGALRTNTGHKLKVNFQLWRLSEAAAVYQYSSETLRGKNPMGLVE